MRRTVIAGAVAGIVLLTAALCAAEEQKSIPKEVQEELGYYVGNWTIEGKNGSETAKGKITMTWSAEKHAIFGDCSISAGKERFHSVFASGWDSTTGGITEQGLSADGEVYTIRYKLKTPDVLIGEATGSVAGKATQGKVRVEKKGPNQYVWSLTGNKRGDEALPDSELTFTRVSKKPKGEAQN